MHLSFALGNKEVLDWLLDQGLDINAPSEGTWGYDGGTEACDNTVEVLNRAAAYGDIDLFDHLVARGAKPTHSNALHHTAGSSNAAAMIAHLIDKYKFDVNADDTCGGLNELTELGSGPWGSPLNYAIEFSNLPAVETLLKYGAEIGDGPAIAIGKKNAPGLKIFLDKGADPTKALDIAACSDYVEGCKLCLEYGGDIAIVEARDREVASGRSPHKEIGTKARRFLCEWK